MSKILKHKETGIIGYWYIILSPLYFLPCWYVTFLYCRPRIPAQALDPASGYQAQQLVDQPRRRPQDRRFWSGQSLRISQQNLHPYRRHTLVPRAWATVRCQDLRPWRWCLGCRLRFGRDSAKAAILSWWNRYSGDLNSRLVWYSVSVSEPGQKF